jgi:hypothetical protein
MAGGAAPTDIEVARTVTQEMDYASQFFEFTDDSKVKFIAASNA